MLLEPVPKTYENSGNKLSQTGTVLSSYCICKMCRQGYLIDCKQIDTSSYKKWFYVSQCSLITETNFLVSYKPQFSSVPQVCIQFAILVVSDYLESKIKFFYDKLLCGW